MSMHTKDDIKYIKNIKNNKVDVNDLPLHMCAIYKKVDEIKKNILTRIKMNHLNLKNQLSIMLIMKKEHQLKFKFYLQTD